MNAKLAAAVALAVAAVVAACSSPHAVQTSGTAAPVSTTPPSLDICTIYAQQHDAQIEVSPGDTSECNELIKDLATSGTFWSYSANGASPMSLTQACDVTSSDGTYEAVVLDDSGGFLGQEACSAFAAGSWTVNAQPGPLSQQITEAQAQAQQIQASASASAASAQAAQSAESSAADDLAALKQDTSLSGDVSQVGGDVTQTGSDLRQTRSDAAGGNGDQCINASTTVYNDAATTVYNDVLTTVFNDAGRTADDIATLRKDIATVQGDQSALASSGLPGTPGARAAISAARAAISSAISTVNGYIDHANGDLSAAYTVANSVGTGACAGDGPGKAPSGVDRLK
jgi:hypothetical protein